MVWIVSFMGTGKIVTRSRSFAGTGGVPCIVIHFPPLFGISNPKVGNIRISNSDEQGVNLKLPLYLIYTLSSQTLQPPVRRPGKRGIRCTARGW
jgi:hypothetical protein